MDKNIHITKPFIKWVGGKTQIIDKIINKFPAEINNYHEPFLGGGSVLLALLSYVKCGAIKVSGNIYAYDVNEPLIYTYKNIQTRHIELYDALQTIIRDFSDSDSDPSDSGDKTNRKPENILEAKVSKENYYYWIRSRYNKLCLEEKKGVLGSAMFIFLNKTCFRGLFRVGPNGFNVPYGHYKNPEIINKGHLEELHNLIQGVIFECCDFTISLKGIEPNDFVYLDPPYAPEKATSFVGYSEKGFSIECHNNLFTLIHNLTEPKELKEPKEPKVLLSNADVPLVRDNFTSERYKILQILCKRSINSKNPDAKTNEVIISNY
jgi:DNA adenine methylase